MATDDQIMTVLNSIATYPGCSRCGTRIRFGDIDCPHCGLDLEDGLHQWAERLVDEILG